MGDIAIDIIKQMLQHANKLMNLEITHRVLHVSQQFDENYYRELLPMVLVREPRTKLEITHKYSFLTGKRNDWREELKILNGNPNLTIFINCHQF